MRFDPPYYEWEAADVRQAIEHLEAVQNLIDAHMASLAGGQQGRREIERGTPVTLRISLDLNPVVERINDKRTVEALAAELDETEAP